jgi:hypothetical protein
MSRLAAFIAILDILPLIFISLVFNGFCSRFHRLDVMSDNYMSGMPE